MTATLRAVIWDVDGTIAETEEDGHRRAFNLAFEEAGLPWRWDAATYGRLLAVAGGFERLMADLAGRDGAPAEAAKREQLARALHLRKNRSYAALVAGGAVAARPGVLRLMDECAGAGIACAVATTTSRVNLEALFVALFGAAWQTRFAAVVCAEDAPRKKPDPQAYRLALARLGIAPAEALAIEDSPAGLAAATSAGIATLVTRSHYFGATQFPAAALVCDDLDTLPPGTDAAGGGQQVDVACLRDLVAHRNASLRA